MSEITINNMVFYANHGVHQHEALLLTKFSVDIILQTDTTAAEKNDDIASTINYETIFTLVAKEMQKKVKLIEHLAHNIANTIEADFSNIDHFTVLVKKYNPPMGGQVGFVSFKLAR